MRRIPIFLPLLLLPPACGADPTKPAAPPAKAEPVAHESELLKFSDLELSQHRHIPGLTGSIQQSQNAPIFVNLLLDLAGSTRTVASDRQ